MILLITGTLIGLAIGLLINHQTARQLRQANENLQWLSARLAKDDHTIRHITARLKRLAINPWERAQ